MSKVLKLGITSKFGEKIINVQNIEVVQGRGVLKDRHFSENKNKREQISLIESENIDYYNNKSNTQIPYISFRRNVITKGIKLNDLVGNKIIIGSIELLAHDLCRPCKHLQEILGFNDIIKEFLLKGGLRCEIINSGKISVGDKITRV